MQSLNLSSWLGHVMNLFQSCKISKRSWSESCYTPDNGASDVDGATPGNQADFIFESFAQCFEQIVNTAQNARLKIIVGTDPFAWFGDINTADQWVRLYCAARNVPLIDHQTFLYQNASNPTYTGRLWSAATPHSQVPGWLPVPSQQAYELMTQAAEAIIGQVIGTLTLQAGYLGTTTRQAYEDAPVEQGVNRVVAGSPVVPSLRRVFRRQNADHE
jgi:hypothetical protein